MNINTRTPMSRRTALQGVGTTIALPFLESMLPRTAFASTTAAGKAIPKRMGIFYFGTGMNMREIEPIDTGVDYTLPPTLQVLERHRKDFTFMSGTYLEHGGGHEGDYTFSTGAKAKDAGTIKNTISMDQVARLTLAKIRDSPACRCASSVAPASAVISVPYPGTRMVSPSHLRMIRT